MIYRQLYPNGPAVSLLGLGTWQFGDTTGTFREISDSQHVEIVRKALNVGINFFDTAEAYGGGQSERVLGNALRACDAKRQDYLIASKILIKPEHSPERVRQACEETLRNLGMEYLDLYQVHWPVEDVSPFLRELIKLKEEGKIRAIGVSNFGPTQLSRIGSLSESVITNQLPYSLLCRPIEKEILEGCKSRQIGILAYSPLAQGLLADRYASLEDALTNQGLARSRLFNHTRSALCRHKEEGCEKELFDTLNAIRKVVAELSENGADVTMASLAIAWLAAKPEVTSVLAGATRPEQLELNAKGIVLSQDPIIQARFQELDEITLPILEYLGGNPDLWDAESRYK